MKSFIRTVVVAACLCFAFALVGCQGTAGEDVGLKELDVDGNAPFYVLVIGNDSRENTIEENNGNDHSVPPFRSDTMMLVRIDPKTYKVGLVTVPRDTATTLNGQTVKLNEVYRDHGPLELMNEVEQITGVEIEYYLNMGFVQFEKFIDAFGGVEANVPLNMSLKDIVSGKNISLQAGTQELDGPEALVLARVRKVYADDLDACRQIQDRQIVQKGIQKVLDSPLQAAANAEILLDNMETNWEAEDLISVVVDFANNADKVTFVSGTGPYKGDIDPSSGLWIATRDEATWSKVIDAVEKGEDPTKIVPLPAIKAA